VRRGGTKARWYVELVRHGGTRLARYRLGAQLRELARAVILEARVDVGGDREAQDDVPEECQALVRALALVDPGGVCERLFGEVVGELIE
jgi:hypothetical protein